MLEKDEASKPYALQLVKGINYKDSIAIIQLKQELLTYSISPALTFLSHYGQGVWIHNFQVAQVF